MVMVDENKAAAGNAGEEEAGTGGNGAGESGAKEGQQSSGNGDQQPAFDYDWYKKDARWGDGKLWKEDKDISKAYFDADKILETKYKPAYKEYTDLKVKLQENGITMENLQDSVKEFQDLKDPENNNNQIVAFLNQLADDDISKQELDMAFSDLQEKKMQRRYAGLDKSQREAAIVRDREITELKNWKETMQQTALDEQSSVAVRESLKAIGEISKLKGFEFTSELKNEFLDHCINNNIPTTYMAQEFRKKYDEALDSAFENKIKAGVLTSQQSTKTKTLNTKITKPKVTGTKENLEEKLKSLFNPKK